MQVTTQASIQAAGDIPVTLQVNPKEGYLPNFTVTLTASWSGFVGGTGPFSGSIDWGDGAVNTFYSVVPKTYSKTHAYTKTGLFNIAFSVIDAQTLSTGSILAENVVSVGSPLVISTFSVAPQSGRIPLSVAFNLDWVNGFAPWSWSLDFGDGTPLESGSGIIAANHAVARTHVYSSIGSYTAKAVVTDALGTTTTRKISIGAGVTVGVPAQVYILAASLIAGAVGIILGVKR